jgi:transposase-like protein
MEPTTQSVTCPHCDSSRILEVPQIVESSLVTWYRCQDCKRLFSTPRPEPAPIK